MASKWAYHRRLEPHWCRTYGTEPSDGGTLVVSLGEFAVYLGIYGEGHDTREGDGPAIVGVLKCLEVNLYTGPDFNYFIAVDGDRTYTSKAGTLADTVAELKSMVAEYLGGFKAFWA